MDNPEELREIKFKCTQCARCCRGSTILLSPYDILRICQHKGLSTPQFHVEYTAVAIDAENQNLLTCLLQTSPGCHFLDGNKCSIYQYRPLGCRTYPLTARPFYDGKTFKYDYSILEHCAGFKTQRRISLSEFKTEQSIDPEEIIRPWLIFKTEAINTDLPQTEEYYHLFFNICYDFDNILFQNLLRKLNLTWPQTIEEKYQVILSCAHRFLLDPYPPKTT